jgi:hypothetical protein
MGLRDAGGKALAPTIAAAPVRIEQGRIERVRIVIRVAVPLATASARIVVPSIVPMPIGARLTVAADRTGLRIVVALTGGGKGRPIKVETVPVLPVKGAQVALAPAREVQDRVVPPQSFPRSRGKACA